MDLAVTGRTRGELCVLQVERQTDCSWSVHCLNVNHICNSSLHFEERGARSVRACGRFEVARQSPLL